MDKRSKSLITAKLKNKPLDHHRLHELHGLKKTKLPQIKQIKRKRYNVIRLFNSFTVTCIVNESNLAMIIMEDDFIYREESYLIIGCCMEVHKQLGCGFKEAVYQEALEMEYIENDLRFERERKLKIHYKGKRLKVKYSPDFICFDKIILELKATNELTNMHKSQLFNYLKVSEFPLGLLINFGTPYLQYKRFIL